MFLVGCVVARCIFTRTRCRHGSELPLAPASHCFKPKIRQGNVANTTRTGSPAPYIAATNQQRTPTHTHTYLNHLENSGNARKRKDTQGTAGKRKGIQYCLARHVFLEKPMVAQSDNTAHHSLFVVLNLSFSGPAIFSRRKQMLAQSDLHKQGIRNGGGSTTQGLGMRNQGLDPHTTCTVSGSGTARL